METGQFTTKTNQQIRMWKNEKCEAINDADKHLISCKHPYSEKWKVYNSNSDKNENRKKQI